MEPPIITTGKIQKPQGRLPTLAVRIPHEMHNAITDASKASGVLPSIIGRRALALGLRKALREALATRGDE